VASAKDYSRPGQLKSLCDRIDVVENFAGDCLTDIKKRRSIVYDNGSAVTACRLAKLLRHHRHCGGCADGLAIRSHHPGFWELGRVSSPWSGIRLFTTPNVMHFDTALLIAALLSAPWPAPWPVGMLVGLAHELRNEVEEW
jgi:hypothetical protein